MMSLPLSLALMVALLGAEWLYVRAFFTRVEPALVARVETALGVRIGFGLLHHWEVREAAGEPAQGSPRAGSLAVAAIQLGAMMVFALGLLAVAAAISAPAILWGRLRS
jgi:hypothetical protein